jgi:acetylornithine/succinyldiaminopimelate/putrescine aminotransferase
MDHSSLSETTMALADKVLFPTYKRAHVVLVKGEGCRLWDEDGKEYLDFVGGIAVCALGHSSPIVSRALEDQSRKLVHVSNLYYQTAGGTGAAPCRELICGLRFFLQQRCRGQ